MKLLLSAAVLIFLLQNANAQAGHRHALKQLQGVWLQIENGDTTGLFRVEGDQWYFEHKGQRVWSDPYRIRFSNTLPQYSDARGSCRFILLLSGYDTLFKEITDLTENSVTLIHHPMNTTQTYVKADGLRPGFSFAPSVFGTWWDEQTQIILKPDSSFALTYFCDDSDSCEYITCGNFTFDGSRKLTLTDAADLDCIAYEPDPDSLMVRNVRHREEKIKNQFVLFDENHEIHLYYNFLGLWLRETKMILVRMNSEEK